MQGLVLIMVSGIPWESWDLFSMDKVGTFVNQKAGKELLSQIQSKVEGLFFLKEGKHIFLDDRKEDREIQGFLSVVSNRKKLLRNLGQVPQKWQLRQGICISALLQEFLEKKSEGSKKELGEESLEDEGLGSSEGVWLRPQSMDSQCPRTHLIYIARLEFCS